MSFDSNNGAFLQLFNRYLGNTAVPIKNAINAMANVAAKLPDTEFSESSRNNANTKRTISGLNISDFKIMLLFR